MLIYRITNNPFHKKRFISTYQSPKNTIPFHPQKQIPLEANNEVKTPNAEAKQQKTQQKQNKKARSSRARKSQLTYGSSIDWDGNVSDHAVPLKGTTMDPSQQQIVGTPKRNAISMEKRNAILMGGKKKRNFDEVVGREGYLISGN